MNEKLRFPDGASVEQAKKDAKKLAASKGISLNDALNIVVTHHGCVGKWQDVMNQLEESGTEELPRCVACSGIEALFSRHQPEGGGAPPVLTPIPIPPSFRFIPVGESDERIHRKCVNDLEYGFCGYCGEDVAYQIDVLNANGECPDHAGESDMSEEERADMEDYIENVQKNG